MSIRAVYVVASAALATSALTAIISDWGNPLTSLDAVSVAALGLAATFGALAPFARRRHDVESAYEAGFEAGYRKGRRVGSPEVVELDERRQSRRSRGA